ncbi:unnamed protein product, partial [Staurois parvus]
MSCQSTPDGKWVEIQHFSAKSSNWDTFLKCDFCSLWRDFLPFPVVSPGQKVKRKSFQQD